MQTVSVTVPKPYAPLFDRTVKEIVEPSGRVSGKSTSNEILAVSLMRERRENNVWYCRAEKADIRDTIFASMIATIQMMRLESEFVWSVSPFQITCLTTGARCYFSGINGKTDDDLTATKGFTPQGKTLALCILDEADEVKHPNHIEAWLSTAVRFLLPYGKVVFAHNPPVSRSHWVVDFFGKRIDDGAVQIKCTWKDIAKLLPARTIEDILRKKRNDPEGYRYWYLGEPVNFRGMVYPQLKRDEHIVNIWQLLNEGDRVVEVVIGLDEGTANDSTCATPLAIMMSGRAVVLDCFENDPLIAGQQAPTQQSEALQNWLKTLIARYPFIRGLRRRWIFECAEGGQMLKLQFENDTGENCTLVTNKSIVGDILRVRSMLAEKILLFHVAPDNNTMQLVKDMETYQNDEKTNMPKKGQRDDTIDSLEYATKLYYNRPMKGMGFGG